MSARQGVSFGVVVLAIVAATMGLVGATARSAHATFAKPEVKLTVLPGLEAVSHGQVVTYTATIKNTTPLPLLHVQFHNPAPSTGSATATDPVASCGGSLSGTTYVCPAIAKLAKGETATVTISWRAPASGTTLTSGSFWKVVKVLKFDSPNATVSLLASNNPSQAAGVQASACTNPATSLTLETYQVLDTEANPLSSRVCAPAPSLIASITESETLPKAPGSLPVEVSQICLAAVGPLGCAVPFIFPASTPATLTFRIDNESLPKICKNDVSFSGYHGGGGNHCYRAKIRKVFHDPDNDGPAPYAQVHSSKVTISTGHTVTTVVVKTTSNGRWDFG
jgi:uncharacterized repeat protein (TIGR01451 family)